MAPMVGRSERWPSLLVRREAVARSPVIFVLKQAGETAAGRGIFVVRTDSPK